MLAVHFATCKCDDSGAEPCASQLLVDMHGDRPDLPGRSSSVQPDSASARPSSMHALHPHAAITLRLMRMYGGVQFDSSYRNVHEALAASVATPKVSDFGMALHLQMQQSHASNVKHGTPFYTGTHFTLSRWGQLMHEVKLTAKVTWPRHISLERSKALQTACCTSDWLAHAHKGTSEKRCAGRTGCACPGWAIVHGALCRRVIAWRGKPHFAKGCCCYHCSSMTRKGAQVRHMSY